MSYGFEPGRIYNRRSDIHARFGGQQQGGIITPSQHSLVIIITGEEGLEVRGKWTRVDSWFAAVFASAVMAMVIEHYVNQIN
jgi:hypothetical protein